jgi:hypothetical protein
VPKTNFKEHGEHEVEEPEKGELLFDPRLNPRDEQVSDARDQEQAGEHS